MAYYTALITAWNTSTAAAVSATVTGVAGVTGQSLNGLTTANKIVAVNGWTRLSPRPAILNVTDVINAIVAADLLACTATQLQVLQLITQGGETVNGSPGTTVRTVFQSIFAGKATTLANLTALISPFDNGTAPWWSVPVANGGGGLSGPVSQSDTTVAGVS